MSVNKAKQQTVNSFDLKKNESFLKKLKKRDF
jgi:hypothetical protein